MGASEKFNFTQYFGSFYLSKFEEDAHNLIVIELFFSVISEITIILCYYWIRGT